MAHPSFFGVARMAETMVGRIIIRVVGRKNGMRPCLELEQEQQKWGGDRLSFSGRLPISLTPWVRVSGDDATASATTDSTVANSASAAVATVGHTSRERE